MWGRIKRNKLDILFSEYIRKKAKGICERCGRNMGWKNLDCSHFHGRRKMSVRYNEQNCSALCKGCHRFFTENPAQHTDFFIKRLGEKEYKKLMLDADIPKQPDYKLLEIYYTKLLSEIEKK